jgi:hypothetical protein
MTVAKVTMPRDVVVGMDDRLTLPDGTKGPVVSVGDGTSTTRLTGRGYVGVLGWRGRNRDVDPIEVI